MRTSVPILAFTEYWGNILKLNSSFTEKIRQEHFHAGYTSFYQEHFRFPPTGPMPTVNSSDSFSLRIRTMISNAMHLQEPCFNIQHITDTCPTNAWTPHSPDAFPLPPAVGTVAAMPDPLLNPEDRGPYLNLTVVRNLLHVPPGREWSGKSLFNVYTNPRNVSSGDDSPSALFTVLPGVLERIPGRSLFANGQLDMLIPSNGTLLSLQNATWRGAQGFSEYLPNILNIPSSGLNSTDEEGVWGGYTKLEHAGRSGEMGRWAFERGVGFIDVAYAGHAIGRYNAPAMFRIIEVLLGRVGVEEGFSGHADWSIQIDAPAAEGRPTNVAGPRRLSG